MRFSEWVAFVQDVSTPNSLPSIFRGPDLPDIPGRHIVFSQVGGAGISLEAQFDTMGFQARCVGEQNDPQNAEDIALALDSLLRSLGTGTRAGVRILSLTRSGSPPTPDRVDDADRTHYVCSYQVTTATHALT